MKPEKTKKPVKRGKPGKPPAFKIESVTETDKSVEVLFNGVRLVHDGISSVQESEFEGTRSLRFVAGLEIPETKEVTELVKRIRTFFKNYKSKSWAANVALDHFDRKKFQESAYNPEHLLLYPSAPAEEVEDGKGGVSYRAKGRLFVNPSHDVFYAGCYVDAKIAFVANTKGTIVVKDYLNAIRFAADGEEITGASDPWGGSQSRQTVGKK